MLVRAFRASGNTYGQTQRKAEEEEDVSSLRSFLFQKLLSSIRFMYYSHKSKINCTCMCNPNKCRFKLRSILAYYYREFTKLRRQLQCKRHIKIDLCVQSSLLRLFHVGRVVQNRRSALSLAWHEWFSSKGREWKIYCCELALSSEPQLWKFHVVVWQTTSKHCTKKRAARAARLFFVIQPIKSLICGVVVDVAVVKS